MADAPTHLWLVKQLEGNNFTLVLDEEEAKDWLDLDPAIYEYVPLKFKLFVEKIAECGCTARSIQPYPCEKLPGYDKKLWCVGCLAKDLLKEDDQ